MSIDMAERKYRDMREMQQEAQGNGRCPKCGAVEWRGTLNSSVEVTRHPDTGAIVTKRERICQCGQYRVRTTEMKDPPPGFTIKVVPLDEG